MTYLCADRFASYAGLTVPAFTPARTSGYAPLYVFFDATAVTDTSVANVFRDLLYVWDFGDGSAGTWAAGNASVTSKNAAFGPIAGHLYEAAGTYTVTLTVFNGYVSKQYVYSNCVTVTSQDSAYLTTATVVVSTSGTFSGEPTGATRVTSSDFDSVMATHAGNNKRIMFRRGETFIASAESEIAFSGLTLNYFGASGALPVIQASGMSAGSSFLDVRGSSDTRIMNLNFDGNSGNADFAIRAAGADISQLTIFNCTAAEIDSRCFVWDPDQDETADQIAIVQCTLTAENASPGARYAIYGGGTRCAFMGNTITHTNQTEAATRSPRMNLSVYQHNSVTQTSMPEFKPMYKLHSPDFELYGTETDKVIVSDNLFTGDSTVRSGLTCAAADSSPDWIEHISNVIAERNYTITESTSPTPMLLYGQHLTARNNIFKATSAGSMAFIGMGPQDSVDGPAPADLYIANNAMYTDASNTATGIDLTPAGSGDQVDGATIYNNAVYAPSAGGGSSVLVSASATGVVTGGNSTNSQMWGGSKVNPFVNFTAFAPANYAIGGGSASTTALQDYAAAQRYYGNISPTLDIGAIKA